MVSESFWWCLMSCLNMCHSFTLVQVFAWFPNSKTSELEVAHACHLWDMKPLAQPLVLTHLQLSQQTVTTCNNVAESKSCQGQSLWKFFRIPLCFSHSFNDVPLPVLPVIPIWGYNMLQLSSLGYFCIDLLSKLSRTHARTSRGGLVHTVGCRQVRQSSRWRVENSCMPG